MPTFLETRKDIRRQVGRSMGLMTGPWAVTASSTSFIRAQDLAFRSAELGRGLEILISDGGGSGQGRVVISSTALVQGTGTLLYFNRDFGTAPSTSSRFELWRGIDPGTVDTFIDDAIRKASRRYLEHKEDYSIQLGDPLRHWGSFERWLSGASAAPDGWTLSTESTESVARESTIIYSGRYSAALTNAASNTAYLESDNIKGFPKFAGEVISVKCKLWASAGSRVRVQLLDGAATFSGTYHSGSGGWEESLIDNVTVNSNLSQLKVRCTIETGDAITAYFGKVWMEHDGQVYDFDLPADVLDGSGDETAFATISEVWAESTSQAGEYNTRIPNEFWRIDRDSATRRIVFTKGLIDQFSSPGRGIKIVGQRHARTPNADTDNIEVDPDFVRSQTMVAILDASDWDDMDRSKRDRWERAAAERLANITTAVYPDSVVVEL